MGLFSRFRKTSKKDKRQSKGKQRESLSASKPRYVHIPTHAAVDALNGAPSSWKQEDQTRIRQLNARRTMLSMQLDVSVAELLERMPSPPLAGPSNAHQYLNTPVTPRWAREPLRLRERASVTSPLRESYVVAGEASTEPSPVPSLTNSASSDTSTNSLQLTRRISKRPHPRPKIFESEDVFTSLHRSASRKVGEAKQTDDLFTVSPEKYEVSPTSGKGKAGQSPRPRREGYGRRLGGVGGGVGRKPPSLGIARIEE